jgi:hypothetical protein
MVSASPSTSLSLASSVAGASVSAVSSSVLAVSIAATGASFTGVTSKRKVLGAKSKPPELSCTLKLKLA